MSVNENPANSDKPQQAEPLDRHSTHSPEPQDKDLPQPSRQCKATKRDGSPCKALRVHGEDTCALHSPRGAEIRAKAVQASVEARQGKVEARKQAQEEAKLSLGQVLRLRAAERQAELVAALIDRAVDGDMRAQSIVWERIEGKVTDRLEVKAGDPFEMDQGELFKWLSEDAAMPEQPDKPDS